MVNITMPDMAKKKGHKSYPLQLRLHELLRQQLEILVKQNLSTMTAEITIALREHLRKNGLWPPPPAPPGHPDFIE